MKNLFNAPRSTTFIVAGGDQANALSATAGSLVALDDFANNKVNIADAQIGVVVDESNTASREKQFLVTAETYPVVQKVRILQGTPNSTDISNVSPFMFNDKAYVASNPLSLKSEIHVASTPFAQSYSSSWLFGGTIASGNGISPVDGVIYKVKLAFGGRQQKKRYSNAGTNRMFKNFVKDTTSYTNDVDRFLKKICTGMNDLSSIEGRKGLGYHVGNKPAVALAINIGGGAGTTLATLAGAALGSKITYETRNSVVAQLTVTADLKATFVKAIANTALTTASTIEVIDMSVAGAAAMGAGAVACDAILFLGIDMKPAQIDDRVADFKTTIEQVGLEGFASTVGRVIASRPFKGYGYGYQLYKQYLERAQMEINGIETFPLENRPMPNYPKYLATDNTAYNVHEIWHTDIVEAGNTTHPRVSQIVILVPIADTATTASMNANLRLLLNSAPNITLHSDSTSAAMFV